MLQIDRRHRLVGDEVSYQATPNVGGALRPRWLVLHYTAGRSLESSVASLCTRKPSGNASAHVVLGRDGRIVQLAPFNVVTWHAGVSAWEGVTGLNAHSIGIEMDNAGALDEIGGRHFTWFRQEVPAAEVQIATHRHGGARRGWHAYTGAQIERALELAEVLVTRYGLEDVLGHEDIAPGRKSDPGPAFPLEAVRARVAGREADTLGRWVVEASALNIRRGPGAQYETVAAPLVRGTTVLMLEPGSRFSRVEILGNTDLEGWVATDYLRPAAAAVPRRAAAPRSRRSAPAEAASAEPQAVPESAAGRGAETSAEAAPKAARRSSRRSRAGA